MPKHLQKPKSDRELGSKALRSLCGVDLDELCTKPHADLQWTELHKIRSTLVAAMRQLNDKAVSGGNREFHDEEQLAWDEADRVVQAINAEFDFRSSVGIRMPFAEAAKRGIDMGFRPVDTPAVAHGGGAFHRTASGPLFRDDKGNEIRALTKGERLVDQVARNWTSDVPIGDVDLGRFLKGVVTGNWKHADAEWRVMKDLGISIPSAGGFLVPEVLSAQLIDFARNHSRIFQAGATTLPMEAGHMTIARVKSDPTTYWAGENETVTLSDVTFNRVQLNARKLIAIVPVSRELLQDAANIEMQLGGILSRAVATELDKKLLVGDGSEGEPLGLDMYPTANLDVQEYSMGANGAALADYSPFSQAWQQILAANGPQEGLSVIMASRTAGEIDRLQDTTNQPMMPPPSWAGIQKLSTQQVPIDQEWGSATDASSAYLGDFTQMIVGVRQGIELEVSREAKFTKDQVLIKCSLRADMAIQQPTWFSIVRGIIPPS